MWPFRKKKPAPAATAQRSPVPDAIGEILQCRAECEEDWFVVFETRPGLFVQYSATSLGLQLNWPKGNKALDARQTSFLAYVNGLGYEEITLPRISPAAIDSIPPGQYIDIDDGIYLQAGLDAAHLVRLTEGLLIGVIGEGNLASIQVKIAPHAG